jgi:hypothetical protein
MTPTPIVLPLPKFSSPTLYTSATALGGFGGAVFQQAPAAPELPRSFAAMAGANFGDDAC